MDERNNKAMNELKMSNTEETNKLSAKEYCNKIPTLGKRWMEFESPEDELNFLVRHLESFSSIIVEQEKESIRQFLISEGFEMLAEKI